MTLLRFLTQIGLPTDPVALRCMRLTYYQLSGRPITPDSPCPASQGPRLVISHLQSFQPSRLRDQQLCRSCSRPTTSRQLSMARPQPHPILSQLRSARTTLEQTAALRALKNEIVGHMQRKETWIAHGVLQPIVRTIGANRQPTSLNVKDAGVQVGTRPLSDDDGTKLQALQLVASFAHGLGPLPIKSVQVRGLTMRCYRRSCVPRTASCGKRAARHLIQHLSVHQPSADCCCCSPSAHRHRRRRRPSRPFHPS